jgi:hypothetical protein
MSASDGPLVVWRDSVAAGDDADAPHEWLLPLAPDATVADLLRSIASARYLASIRTGQATWIIEGARPLAVVAQQWMAPRFLVDPATPIRDVVKLTPPPHVEARYWLQVSPERVFEALHSGQPLPDRYTR